MTNALAGLRYPLSLTLGLLLTASLFTLLWVFTDKTFDVIETQQVRIEFSRIERDVPPETRRREKPAREDIEEPIEVPPIDGPGNTRVELPQVVRDTPQIALDRSIAVAGSDREAAPLFRVNPTYPPRAAMNGIEGWVRVQYDIAASGAVTNVVAVESEPGTVFDQAAIDAVARWRYNPSVVEGRAVERIGMQTLLRFTLEDGN